MWSSWCRRRCGRHKPPRAGVGGCGRACGQGQAIGRGARTRLRESGGLPTGPGARGFQDTSVLSDPQRHRHVQCAHLASGLRVTRSNRVRALSDNLRGASAAPTDKRVRFGSGRPEGTSHAPTRGIARGACVAHPLRIAHGACIANPLRTRLALASPSHAPRPRMRPARKPVATKGEECARHATRTPAPEPRSPTRNAASRTI